MYPFVDKTDMQLVHYAFCHRSCRFSATNSKEQRFLCQMVSSELNFKTLACDCTDSALLWPFSKERPCRETSGGMCCPAPEGLVGERHRKAGKLVFKPGSSSVFLKRCIDQTHPPAGRDRLSVNVVFVVFLPLQTRLALCCVTAWKGHSFPDPVTCAALS